MTRAPLIPDEEVFTDGNMAQVVRRGTSVFRAPAPWAEASRQVLRHLEGADFPWSPRLLGTSDVEDELSFVPGRSIPADLAGHEEESMLVQVGTAIRALHDALAGFGLAPGTAFVVIDHAPRAATILCHNDLAPSSITVFHGALAGFIDWDLVAPGAPAWDLAYAAWRFAPIYPAGRTGFTPAGQAARVVVLLDAYGLPAGDRAGLVDLVLLRQRSAVTTVERLGRERVPGFVRLYDGGLHLSGIDDREWLESHRGEFVRIIERARR